jgi:hypothetical protein
VLWGQGHLCAQLVLMQHLLLLLLRWLRLLVRLQHLLRLRGLWLLLLLQHLLRLLLQ